ncbi:MAG TPA: VOC family protein [Candidatus Limnocylindrales bacterium]|nr:VOC family protein [Candidatus Limnocylindrales bacterium]
MALGDDAAGSGPGGAGDGSAGLPIAHVVLDCADAEALAPFWSAMLGLERRWRMGQFVGLEDPDGRRHGLILQQVPEPKTLKNRMHLDLATPDLEGTAARVEALGGRRIVERREGPAHWIVVADPEDNEFCLAEVAG